MNDLLNLEELKYYSTVLQDALLYLHADSTCDVMFVDYKKFSTLLSVFDEDIPYPCYGTSVLHTDFFYTKTSSQKLPYHELNAETVFNTHVEYSNLSNESLNEILIIGSLRTPFIKKSVHVYLSKLLISASTIEKSIKDKTILCL